MTVLVSANTKRVGRGGFGTLGSLIPTESFFFDDVDDVNAIWRGEITRLPAGKLFAFNDGTFTYEGADSSFDYTVYKNGAAVGSYTVTLGSPSATDIEATITFNMPQFAVSISAEQSVPDGAATAAFTMPQLIVSASAENQSPDFIADVSFTMPQFGIAITAESTQPSSGALVSFTMPQFSLAADADNTPPNYQADIGFTMPQFSITVTCGDIVFGTSKGARTEIVAHSRRSEYNQ